MSAVMIRCPNTGLAIATGIETDSESLRRIPDVLGFAQCPHCHSEHAWWTDEAWLAVGSGKDGRIDLRTPHIAF